MICASLRRPSYLLLATITFLLLRDVRGDTSLASQTLSPPPIIHSGARSVKDHKIYWLDAERIMFLGYESKTTQTADRTPRNGNLHLGYRNGRSNSFRRCRVFLSKRRLFRVPNRYHASNVSRRPDLSQRTLDARHATEANSPNSQSRKRPSA